MFDNIQRMKQLQTVVQDPTSSEYVQALVTVLSTLEHRQLQAVENLHDALDIDGVDVQADREAREEQLLSLVEALASGEFEAWWFEEVIAEHIENAEDARAYAGLSEEEWQEQRETWADLWRDRGGEEFESHSDTDLGRLHIERKFGVSLREFEREVVGFNRKDAMQTGLAGNVEAVEQGIKAASAEARNLDTDAADDGGEAGE